MQPVSSEGAPRGTAATQTRHNRTITIDFHDKVTYVQRLDDGKAFIALMIAFLLALGFQLKHKATCEGDGYPTRHSHYVRIRLGRLTIWRLQCMDRWQSTGVFEGARASGQSGTVSTLNHACKAVGDGSRRRASTHIRLDAQPAHPYLGRLSMSRRNASPRHAVGWVVFHSSLRSSCRHTILPSSRPLLQADQICK